MSATVKPVGVSSVPFNPFLDASRGTWIELDEIAVAFVGAYLDLELTIRRGGNRSRY